jgi:hypothetical protein
METFLNPPSKPVLIPPDWKGEHCAFVIASDEDYETVVIIRMLEEDKTIEEDDIVLCEVDSFVCIVRFRTLIETTYILNRIQAVHDHYYPDFNEMIVNRETFTSTNVKFLGKLREIRRDHLRVLYPDRASAFKHVSDFGKTNSAWLGCEAFVLDEPLNRSVTTYIFDRAATIIRGDRVVTELNGKIKLCIFGEYKNGRYILLDDKGVPFTSNKVKIERLWKATLVEPRD